MEYGYWIFRKSSSTVRQMVASNTAHGYKFVHYYGVYDKLYRSNVISSLLRVLMQWLGWVRRGTEL